MFALSPAASSVGVTRGDGGALKPIVSFIRYLSLSVEVTRADGDHLIENPWYHSLHSLAVSQENRRGGDMRLERNVESVTHNKNINIEITKESRQRSSSVN